MKNKNTPLMDLLDKFTAPDVPQFGPGEIPCSVPRFDPTAEPTPENWPGDGLAQHTMLYVGEGCNRMFLVHEGRVIWTCDTGEGWEYDDVWMLKNGDILFSRQSWAGMVSPKKELLWRIDCEPVEEMHTIQPLDDHRCALLVSSDKQPYVIFVDEYTGEILYRHDCPFDNIGHPHGQFRRMRVTPEGHFLVSYFTRDKVVEYDADWNILKVFPGEQPWAAIRLLNGNTLISEERAKRVREVNPDGETVWQYSISEMPEELRLDDSQSCVRLKNGNTILCSRGHGGRPQCAEITKDGEIVWVLRDFRWLKECTAVQILDDPGDPEKLCDCER